MKLFLLILVGIVLLVLSACHHEDNSDLNRTEEICDGIYLEDYTTFGVGAGGGSILGHCLTDSITFRVFVGTFDEGYEGIFYHCQNDSLRVNFFSDEEGGKFHNDISGYYSISGLKLLRNYKDNPFFKFKDLEELATTKAKFNQN